MRDSGPSPFKKETCGREESEKRSPIAEHHLGNRLLNIMLIFKGSN